MVGSLRAKEHEQDFPVVGFHVDLRLQVMPMSALKALAEELSEFGFNAIIMEWEATYPYRDHAIISNRLAYSEKEVREFIRYCDELGLDVIPLQQNFGHAEYILRHERYAYLRESKKDLQQICPLELEGAQELFEELYDDMLSLHTSKYVHIGGDETRLLGVCLQCSDVLEEHGEGPGKSKLYVDYMKMISDLVIKRGKTPLLWADMILAHPESIVDMPEEAIYIDWNYGWDFDRFGEDPANLIAQYGLRFWGASSIRSAPDDYNVTNWGKHMENQSDYMPYAREAGFEGMILTSWSTSGVYGYEWFMSEVTDLYPLRHPYPHDGFRLNVAAFVQGVMQSEPLNPGKFAREYAVERFGLTDLEGDELWSILSSDLLHAFVTVGSRPLSGQRGLSPKSRRAESYLAAVRKLQTRFSKIVPKANEREFAHFGLQLACREFYLRFRTIEEWAQSDAFTAKDKLLAVRQLEALLRRSAELDRLFLEQFESVLHESEIRLFNDYQSKNVRKLKRRLAGEH